MDYNSYVRRSGRAFPDTPWLSLESIAELDSILTSYGSEARVLEQGAGGSTVFFAERARHVVSYEHDLNWRRQTAARVTDGLVPAQVFLLAYDPNKTDWGQELSGQVSESYDIVFVDGAKYDRTPFVIAAKRLVSPRGYMVVDNTRKPERIYRMSALYDYMDDWPHLDIDSRTGNKPNVCTFWRRPA